MPLSYSDSAEMTVIMELFGRPLINVLKFQHQVAMTLATLTDLALVFEPWIASDLAAGFSDDLTWTGLVITSIDLTNPIQYFHFAGFPHTGGIVGAAVPVNVAAMTRLHTGMIGASRKGRVYNSGLAETSVNGNTIDAITQALIQDAYNELVTQLSTTDWRWIVASGMNEPGPGSGVTTPVLVAQTDTNIHDMGRRLDNN